MNEYYSYIILMGVQVCVRVCGSVCFVVQRKVLLYHDNMLISASWRNECNWPNQ